MPPACSLLDRATPTPPEIQPFRFLKLPIEIRYMVYEYLGDRQLDVAIPGLDLPDCISDGITRIDACLRPAMLRVNKQLTIEYAAVVMPQMILLIDWNIWDPDTILEVEEMQDDQAQPPIFPEELLARLRIFWLRICLNAPIPHCNPQAAIQGLTSRMPKLDFLAFSTEYDIDQVLRETSLPDSTEFHVYNAWTEEMTSFLQELVNDKETSWTAMARFYIVCAFYCQLDPSEEIEQVSDVVYAICNASGEDTFKLDGLNLKFMGMNRNQIESRSFEDPNVGVDIEPHADD